MGLFNIFKKNNKKINLIIEHKMVTHFKRHYESKWSRFEVPIKRKGQKIKYGRVTLKVVNIEDDKIICKSEGEALRLDALINENIHLSRDYSYGDDMALASQGFDDEYYKEKTDLLKEYNKNEENNRRKLGYDYIPIVEDKIAYAACMMDCGNYYVLSIEISE